MMNKKGFTLIEMVLVLVIVGVLLSLTLNLTLTISKTNRIKKTKNNMEMVRDALIGYAMVHQKFPCADTDKDGKGDVGKYKGKVPYKEVGLSKLQAADAYGKVLDYDVNNDLVNSNNFCDSLKNLCNSVDSNTLVPPILDDKSQVFVLMAKGNNKKYEGENADSDRNYESHNPNSDDILRGVSPCYLYSKLCQTP